MGYRAVYNANTQLHRYFCVHSEIRSLFSKATNTQSMLLVLLSKRSLSPPDKDEVSDKLMSKDDKDCGVKTAAFAVSSVRASTWRQNTVKIGLLLHGSQTT